MLVGKTFADLHTSVVIPTRVLIVDAERAFAQALAYRLGEEPTLEILGSASTGPDAEVAISRMNPDVVLMAYLQNREEFASVTSRTRSLHPWTRIVGLASEEDPAQVSALVRAGASAVVVKVAPVEEVIEAIHSAMRNEGYIPPRLLAGVLLELSAEKQRDADEERVARLTPRERDVLACMMAGLDRAGIAERMVLSINTVRTHTQNVLAKLDVHSSLAAVSVALRAGFNDPPAPPREPSTQGTRSAVSQAGSR